MTMTTELLRPTVFVGSSKDGKAIADAIQVNLDHSCEVVLWTQGVFGLGEGTLESLAAKLDTFDFAVLVLTPDDLVESRGKEQNAPRDNVLLELGMFVGAIGRERTFVVYDRKANIKLPSDLAGITPATYQAHISGNLLSALGAPTTLIQAAIAKQGRRRRAVESEGVRQDTHFQIIHGLIDPAIEQHFILMFEQGVKLQRRRSPFDQGTHYEWWKVSGSGGMGGLSVDDMCAKLADADLIKVDLRDQVSLTPRGEEFAKWLVERGHKAECFKCSLGGWGERPSSVPDFLRNAAELRDGVRQGESLESQKIDHTANSASVPGANG